MDGEVLQLVELWLDFWEAAIFVSGPASIAFLGGRYIALTRMVRRRTAAHAG